MVKLIPGRKGSGKTKILLEAIRGARTQSQGNVVVIQTKRSLNAEIKHHIRLVDIEDYSVTNCDGMQGFVGGIMASDYDCTHIFIDGILRIVGEDKTHDMAKIGAMLAHIHEVSGETTEVVLTLSLDEGELTDDIKKYC
ncbi:MAG: hypothetical protein FWG45_07625 [Oscillospiraceae bacterium]|nr:hypothetical protein [Oscillospiraceae bacterium]